VSEQGGDMKKVISFIFTLSLALSIDVIIAEMGSTHIAYAKKKAAKKSGGGSRQRIVVKEAKVNKKRDKTNVDFDETTLEGRRLNPSGVSLNLQKPNKEFDLIKLRRHWKPEMVSSTTSLENR
jgi:hypothetical protein